MGIRYFFLWIINRILAGRAKLKEVSMNALYV